MKVVEGSDWLSYWRCHATQNRRFSLFWATRYIQDSAKIATRHRELGWDNVFNWMAGHEFQAIMSIYFTITKFQTNFQQEQRRAWHMPRTCMMKIRDALVSQIDNLCEGLGPLWLSKLGQMKKSGQVCHVSLPDVHVQLQIGRWFQPLVGSYGTICVFGFGPMVVKSRIISDRMLVW
jgi:hypothetical protein